MKQNKLTSSRQTSSFERPKNYLRRSQFRQCIQNGHVTREKPRKIAARNHGNVTVPHFNRDTVEFCKRDESNPAIKTLLPFLKNFTEESDLENFQDLIVVLDACYWLHKTISISLSRFGDDRAI